jgi:heme oxygenase
MVTPIHRPHRDALRHATRDWHARLEQTRVMKAVLLGTCTADQYGVYLSGMQALVASLLASPALPPGTSFLAKALGARAEWLGQDLRAMGLTPTQPLPVRLESQAQLWGAAYVVEGSALGARVLHRQLLARPDLHKALRALQGWGGQSAQHWQTFVSQLDQLPLEDAALMQETACLVFEELHRRFNESASPHLGAAT